MHFFFSPHHSHYFLIKCWDRIFTFFFFFKLICSYTSLQISFKTMRYHTGKSSFDIDLMWIHFFNSLTLSQTSPGFYVFVVQVCWKHCGKRRNCSLRAISPFHTVFSTYLENFLTFSLNLKLSSANSFSLEELNLSFGKGLIKLLPTFKNMKYQY